MAALNPHASTLYFGYGSNLGTGRMQRRCPGSELVGRGLLRDWKWIISERGYANIIPSPGDVVRGLVYELSELNEAHLDRSEGVPHNYTKEIMAVDFTPVNSPSRVKGHPTETAEMLLYVMVYVDHEITTPSEPLEAYIDKINEGIEDGSKYGIPEAYFERYLRPFIPPPQGYQERFEVRNPLDPQLADVLRIALSTALSPIAYAP